MNKLVNGVANDLDFPILDWCHHNSQTKILQLSYGNFVSLENYQKLQNDNKSLKGNCRYLEKRNHNQKEEIRHLNSKIEKLKLQLKGTTHCYDETELKSFKKKINDIVEYCRTTQMTFEEFIELERIANK